MAVQVHSKNEDYSNSSCESSSSECQSYVSRISQQVFVSDTTNAVQYNKKYQSHDQVLKNKVASFVSSVAKYKSSNINNTKL